MITGITACCAGSGRKEEEEDTLFLARFPVRFSRGGTALDYQGEAEEKVVPRADTQDRSSSIHIHCCQGLSVPRVDTATVLVSITP